MMHPLLGVLHDSLDDCYHEEERTGGSRELSLARTKVQEAVFWAEQHFNDRKERGLDNE